MSKRRALLLHCVFLFNCTVLLRNDALSQDASFPAEPKPIDRASSETLAARIERLHTALRPASPQLREQIRELEKKVTASKWTVVRPTLVESQAGTEFRILEDGSILASGPRGETDVYHLEFESPLDRVGAIRLEVLPHPSLQPGCCGRGENGSFVLTEAILRAATNRRETPRGRFIRVQLEGPHRQIKMNRLQIMSRGIDIGSTGKASISSTASKKGQLNAANCLDDSRFATNSRFEANPWWEVDLGKERPIDELVLWGHAFQIDTRRTMNGAVFTVLDKDRQTAWTHTLANSEKRIIGIPTTGFEPIAMHSAAATDEGEALPESRYRTAAAHAALDGSLESNSGWTITHGGGAQAISFQVEKTDQSKFLSLDLLQMHGKGQVLGHFRISVCDAPNCVLPESIARVLKVEGNERSPAQWKRLEDFVYEKQRKPDDFRADAQWMSDRLHEHIQALIRGEQFTDALAWSHELVELQRARSASIEDRAEAVVGQAILSAVAKGFTAATDEPEAEHKQLISQLSPADHRHHVLNELQGLSQTFENDAKALERLQHSFQSYLLSRASSFASEENAESLPAVLSAAREQTELLGEDSCIAAMTASQTAKLLAINSRNKEAVRWAELAAKVFEQNEVEDVFSAGVQRALARLKADMFLISAGEDRAAFQRQSFAHQQNVLDLYRKLFPEGASEIALEQFYLANLYQRQLNRDGAVAEVESAIEVLRTYPDLYLQLGHALLLLGQFRLSRGEAYQAMLALEEAREVYLDEGWETNPLMSSVLRILGSAFSYQDRGYDARRCWEEAIRIGEINDDAQIIMEVSLEMAQFHTQRDEMSLARELLIRASNILTEKGIVNGDTARCEMMLGRILGAEANAPDLLTKAEKHLVRAKNIYLDVAPRGHAIHGVVLADLGRVQVRLRKLKDAEQNLLSSLDIVRSSRGENHRDYFYVAMILAGLYSESGQPEAAMQLLNRLDDASTHFDPTNSGEAQELRSLQAIASLQLGKFDQAAEYFEASLETREKQSQGWIRELSDSEAVAYQQRTLEMMENCFGALAAMNERDAEKAHNLVWRFRGVLFRELVRRKYLTGKDSTVEAASDQLAELRRKIADLHGNGDASDWSSAWEQQIAILSEQASKLEQSIASQPHIGFQSQAFNRIDGPLDHIRPTDLLQLSELDNAAIVEFIKYDLPRVDDGFIDAVPHYDAIVLRKNGNGFSRSWVKLGEADQIERLVEQWRFSLAPESLVRGYRNQKTIKASPSDQLRRILWEPLEQHLDGVSSIILIPESALWRLPWNAIPGAEPGRFLIEDYALSTVNHGVALYDVLSRPPVTSEGCLLVGGVQYGEPAGPVSKRRSWETLDGSKTEIEYVERLWKNRNVRVLASADATEAKLRELMPQKRIVHIATHGHLASELSSELQETSKPNLALRGYSIPGVNTDLAARHPMLLSWLVMANANVRPRLDARGVPIGPDGLLTAHEVINLQLSNVDLLVLSACETGLGNVVGGEGVFGLQQAFHMAGARSVVASLWPISDSAAVTVMARFHRNLAEKNMDKLAALRDAQIAMLRGELDPRGNRPPVSAWAGWTLSGDWR